MTKAKKSRNADYVALHRARKKGLAPPRNLAPCGTWAAAKRHVRNGDCTTAELKTFCPKCYKANQKHRAEQYQKSKSKDSNNK